MHHHTMSFAQLEIPLTSPDQFLQTCLCAPVKDKNGRCKFYIDEFTLDNNSLLNSQLNNVLCRDFVRKILSVWKKDYSKGIFEAIQKKIFELFSEDNSVPVMHY